MILCQVHVMYELLVCVKRILNEGFVQKRVVLQQIPGNLFAEHNLLVVS
jgi:hypothetical protein